MAFNKTDYFETKVLTDWFNGTAHGLGGSLYIALYSTAYVDDSTVLTEATYTDYARVAVVRSSLGWTVTGAFVTNLGTIQFPVAGTTSTETLRSAAICDAATGGNQLFAGPLNANLVVSTNVQPQFAASNFNIEEK